MTAVGVFARRPATGVSGAAAAEDRAGAGIRADLAGRRAGDTRGLPRQGGRGDLHLHLVHRHLPVLTPMMSFVQDQLGTISAPRSPSYRSPSIRSATRPRCSRSTRRRSAPISPGWSFLTGAPGGDPGRSAPLRGIRVEGPERRRRAHLPHVDRRSARHPPRAISRSALRSRGIPPRSREPAQRTMMRMMDAFVGLVARAAGARAN